MAYSGEQDGRSGLLRFCEFLPKVHLGLLCQSSTSLRLNTLRIGLDVKRKGAGSLQRPQNSGNHCSSVSVSSGIGPLLNGNG